MVEVEGDALDWELTRFDLGKIEDVVDQPQQRVGRTPDDAQVFPLLVVEPVSRTSSVMPMMPFIGVRISWLMLARN